VQGWLKVESYTDPPEALLDYPVWDLALAGSGSPSRSVRVLGGRPHGGKRILLVRLEGIDSPEAAKPYATLEVRVPRSALPPAGPGEYYWVDLLGMEAVTLDGVSLGRVSHFVELPANPVVVVRQGAKEHWVPMAPAHVRRVDLAARRVELDWDPAL
jgi:16S rRNA processing protein RimM